MEYDFLPQEMDALAICRRPIHPYICVCARSSAGRVANMRRPTQAHLAGTAALFLLLAATMPATAVAVVSSCLVLHVWDNKLFLPRLKNILDNKLKIDVYIYTYLL